MATLQLGVLDVAYTQKESNGLSQTTTTGDVATILESQYAVMATFYELRQERIAQALADSMAAALQDRVNGRTVGRNPFYNAEQQIEALFRSFLDADEMSKLSMMFAGQPLSVAAQVGISHRRIKVGGVWVIKKVKRRPGRPAFVDTGLYRTSFRAVVKP